MYGVIVIGAEPAGMTAILYASRSNLSVLMTEQDAPDGQMNNTAEIENCPGLDSIMSPDLAYRIYEGVSRFGTEDAYRIVQGIRDRSSHKEVIYGDKTYEGKTVIIATDCTHRKLGIPGEKEFARHDVSYCAVYDGAFFRNKHLVVIGGGDSAMEEAIYLAQFTSEAVIVHRRDELHTQKIIQDHAFANGKISFMWGTVVEKAVGNEMVVTGAKACNVKTGDGFDLATGEVFIYIGLDPLTTPFREAGLTNEVGWIPTDDEMKTNIPGAFAVGDVREKGLRQITTTVGDGEIAGQQVYKYLESLEETTV